LFANDLVGYIETCQPYGELAVAVCSVESGALVGITYDISFELNEYNELVLCVQV